MQAQNRSQNSPGALREPEANRLEPIHQELAAFRKYRGLARIQESENRPDTGNGPGRPLQPFAVCGRQAGSPSLMADQAGQDHLQGDKQRRITDVNKGRRLLWLILQAEGHALSATGVRRGAPGHMQQMLAGVGRGGKSLGSRKELGTARADHH